MGSHINVSSTLRLYSEPCMSELLLICWYRFVPKELVRFVLHCGTSVDRLDAEALLLNVPEKSLTRESFEPNFGHLQ